MTLRRWGLAAGLLFALIMGWVLGSVGHSRPLEELAPIAVPPMRVASTVIGVPSPAAASERALRPSATSLRGSAVDGAWPVDGQGRLRPDLALRRRFDYWLTAQGEHSLDELTAQLRVQAEAELEALAAAEVMSLWALYVQLQQQGLRVAVQLARPETWRAALAERQTQRRALLGWPWAEAFYREEEAALLRQIEVLETGRAAPTRPAEGPPLHPDAMQREAELRQRWSDWDQRLARANAALRSGKEGVPADAAQRRAVIQAHFAPEEWVRAEALLD